MVYASEENQTFVQRLHCADRFNHPILLHGICSPCLAGDGARHTDPQRDGQCYRRGHPVQSHLDADTIPYAGYSHADGDAVGAPYLHAHPHANAYSHTHRDTDAVADTHVHADPGTDANRGAD